MNIIIILANMSTASIDSRLEQEPFPSLTEVKKYLGGRILSDLERGRPAFDRDHTLAVVSKMEHILEEDSLLDPYVMIIAAYAHDWGYADLFAGGELIQMDQMKLVKPLHMELGAKKTQDLLKDSFFSFLSSTQKELIVHLVAVHDSIKDTESPSREEISLLEADVLGACDVSAVTPTFDPDSNQRWMRNVIEVKVPKFIHTYAIGEAQHLLEERERYYQEHYAV